MQTEILKEIIECIKRTPDAEFNMERWKSVNCSTAVCAIGAYITQHPESELKLELDYTDIHGVKYLKPILGKWEHITAVAEYLGLSFYETEYLFHPWTYPDSRNVTKEEVIERIQKLLVSPNSSNPNLN